MSLSNPTSPLSRRQLLQTGSAIMLTPWLIACSETTPLMIAGHRWPGYELLFMAKDFGDLNHPDLDLIRTASASETMQGLRENRFDAGMLTMDETLRLCSEGMDLQVVLVFNISTGADAVISKPHIQNLNQLQGKTIGVEQGALGAFILYELLSYAGLTRQDVTIKNIPVSQHEASWEKCDVIISYEPYTTKLIKAGGIRLFDSRQMPDMIFDVLAVKTSAIKSHAASLTYLINQHFKALHHLRINPMDAAHRLSNALELTAEEVRQVYRGLFLPDARANYGYLSEKDYRLVQTSQHLVLTLRTAGIIIDDCDLRSIFNNQFISKDML